MKSIDYDVKGFDFDSHQHHVERKLKISKIIAKKVIAHLVNMAK